MVMSRRQDFKQIATEDRAKYREEIRKYLEEHEFNRSATFRVFTHEPHMLPPLFVKQALGRRGLPKTLDDEKRKEKDSLQKSVRKVLVSQGAINEKAIIKTYLHFFKMGMNRRFVRTAMFNIGKQLLELDEEGAAYIFELVRKVKPPKQEQQQTHVAKKLSPKMSKTPKMKKQVQFGKDTLENANKSLRKVPPTPIRDVNGSFFNNNDDNDQEEESMILGEDDCRDFETLTGDKENDGQVSMTPKLESKPFSSSPMSGLKVVTPIKVGEFVDKDNDGQLSQTPKLESKPFNSSPMSGLKVVKPTKEEEFVTSFRENGIDSTDTSTTPKTILRKEKGVKTDKRVSWGKNDSRSPNLKPLTPKPRESINLMSFDTLRPLKTGDDEVPQLVPIKSEDNASAKKKKSPKFSPRLTRSAAKKRNNNNN